MSNAVHFLESLARNPMSLSPEAFASVVAHAELEPEIQQALLMRDIVALNELLGGRPKMICVVAPAENDEPVDDDHDGEGETPEQEESIRAA